MGAWEASGLMRSLRRARQTRGVFPRSLSLLLFYHHLPKATLNLVIMGKCGPSLRDTVVKQGVQFAPSVRQFTPSLARIPI